MLHPRTLSIALLSAAALTVGACGGDDSGASTSSGATDDEAQIRDAVTGYANAIADHDGGQACSYLTDAARKQIETAGKALKANGCAEVMEKITETATGSDRDQLKSLQVTSVKITGNHATAQTKVEGQQTDPAAMVREGGRWKIDIGAGGTSTAATVGSPQMTTTTP